MTKFSVCLKIAAMPKLTTQEIIGLLGGITVVARMLDIKPPSVHAWLKDGIPDSRLVALAAQIELKSGGRFSRKMRWPEKFSIYWPELAQAPASPAQAATEKIAVEAEPVNALRAGRVRRLAERRLQHQRGDGDRRGINLSQLNVTGEA